MKILWSTLLLLCTGVSLHAGLPSLPLGEAVAFLLLALAFEMASPRLPEWGYQSCGVGVYLAVSTHFTPGWGVATVLALNLLFLRGNLRGYRKGFFWTEFLSDALPLAFLTALSSLLREVETGGLLAILGYLLVSYFLPPLLQPGEERQRQAVRQRMLPLIFGLLCTGLLAPADLKTALICLVVYSSLVLATREIAGVQAVSKRELALAHFGAVNEAQEKLEKELATVSRRARSGQEGQRLLAKIQSLPASQDSLEEGLRAVLKAISQVYEARSLVIFLATEEGLLPFAFHSPKVKELQGAALTQLTEPLAQTCLREGRPFYRRKKSWPQRLLPEEKSVVCLPIPGYGVLYLGRSKQAFERSAIDTLTIIARQLGLSIQMVLEKQKQAQKFHFVSDERRRLERWLHRLEWLMEASRSFYQTTEDREVYGQLGVTLQELIPHQTFAVVGDGTQLLKYSPSPEDWEEKQLHTLLERLKSSGASVLEEPGLLGVAVPRHRIGVLLCDPGGENFTKEHKDLLSTLASIAASALDRLRLQEEYLSASKAAAVGQLAAGLSHELNTPLGVVQLQLERAAMQLKKSPEKAEGALSIAETELDRAQRMVSTLLFYSTSYGVEREKINLSSLLEKLISKMDSSPIELKSSGDEIWVNGFLLDMEQMLVQLLQNAADAVAPKAEPRIVVDLSTRQGRVMVDIHDSGDGLTREVAQRAFDPFYTTKPVGKGVGLGLTVASQVAKLHGGKLELLESPLGGVLARTVLPASES